MNKINSFNCILCNSYDLVFELKVRDNDKTDIFKCKKCNLIQLHPRLEIIRERLEDGELDSQDRNRVYSSHDYNKNMNMNYSFNTNASEEEISIHNKMTHVIEADRYRFLDHFKKALKQYDQKEKDLNVLDVGCGYGYWCHTLNENYNFNVLGMDLNINKVLYGKNKLKLNFDFVEKVIEDEKFIESNENQFDIITCWHVIEHVYNPIIFIKNIKRLLKKGGIFLFELPNEDDELFDLSLEYRELVHFQDHCNYFNRETLKYLFEKCNIENKDYDIQCCQRYGFYNYVDWIKYGTKSKVESDDYININDKPRSNIEKIWLKYREENFNADTLYGSFINR